MTLGRVVAITGCDSGLGWSLAARMAREGLITVAGMYNGTDTEAAQSLKKLQVHPCPLDVTDVKSVAEFRKYVMNIVKANSGYHLHAVVNNAGIMIVGDYEWLPPATIEETINVNLLGPMRIVSEFLPELRKTAAGGGKGIKPRIINVASHCGIQPLPGFGPYSASKAGLLAWTQALRLEHRPHGLTAVAFVPGGFITSSNILANQGSRGNAMLEHLDDEQKQFYEKRITTLTAYLQGTTRDTRYDSLRDEKIIGTFMKALSEEHPMALYKVESWRYWVYYNLLKLPWPEVVKYWLIKLFISFPG